VKLQTELDVETILISYPMLDIALAACSIGSYRLTIHSRSEWL